MTNVTPSERPYNILLVEDSPSQAMLTKHALAEASTPSFQLEHVELLADALARLERGGIDAALVDLTLPDSSGLATFRAIHDADRQMPIVVLTGCDDESLALEVLKHGAQDYLLKDEIRPKLLVRSLRFAIERQRTATLETVNRQLQQAQTSLTQTVKRLEQSNEELKQFTDFASHDLQEPLRKLLWYGEALREDAGEALSDEARQDVHFIADAARRMQSLVQALLTLGRAGQTAIQWGPVDLDQCVTEVLDRLSPRIAETNAVIRRDPLPFVSGEATLLTQVYQNLIGNALKFVGDAPPIVSLTAERTGESWLLGVRDNGIGIDPQHAQRIFVPFERLHPREQFEGSGIGLSLCRKVVERHGGRIWVESQPGRGSCFRFLLPIQSRIMTAKPPAQPVSEAIYSGTAQRACPVS